MNVAQALALQDETGYEATIDLAKLARVNRGDRVKIEQLTDRTLELFERTIRLLDAETDQQSTPNVNSIPSDRRFVPEHEDLRSRFLFAEALGSYSALQDLLDAYSPGYRLSVNYAEKVHTNPLSETEVRVLFEYDEQISSALAHANQYLLNTLADGYSYEEIHELNDVLIAARERSKTLTAILGAHLIQQVELSVQRLYEFHNKIRTVQRSIDGIFLIDSEVMFIPTSDLINCVNTIFDAVGNSYVSEHIDGILLLAARNLLIETVSFYSYYGKQQIYNAFRKKQSTVNRGLITHHIRSEIRNLFNACKTDNRLVLTRIMDNAEREFEISVETITEEAERWAVEAVNLLIPEEPAVITAPKKGFFKRISSWLFR